MKLKLGILLQFTSVPQCVREREKMGAGLPKQSLLFLTGSPDWEGGMRLKEL